MKHQDSFERQYPRVTQSAFYQEMGKTCRVYLSKFPCLKNLDESEVLCEAVIRLKKKFIKGQIVLEVDAWIRKCSWNVVREHYRYEINRRNHEIKSVDEENGENDYLRSLDKPIEVEEEYQFLHQALKLMNESERELLYLRFFSDFSSWKEIQQLYVQRGENISEPNLRQRGHRALEKLGKILKQLLDAAQ
jgi:RNA polymerase sigma factor (sigma-70 family)